MTTPIERAVQTLQEVVLTGRRVLTHVQAEDATHAVFNSIDTDELAEALKYDGWEGLDEPLTERDLTLIARTVKNWLTGKDTE